MSCEFSEKSTLFFVNGKTWPGSNLRKVNPSMSGSERFPRCSESSVVSARVERSHEVLHCREKNVRSCRSSMLVQHNLTASSLWCHELMSLSAISKMLINVASGPWQIITITIIIETRVHTNLPVNRQILEVNMSRGCKDAFQAS